MRATFTIPGKPFAKARPKFSRVTGHAYTPAPTVSFERAVGQIAAQHFSAPFAGPVEVIITATFQPPQSWSPKKRAAHMGTPHIQKPDIDNIGKAICDGMNRIAFADDSQIAYLTMAKVWGQVEGTYVSVESQE